MKWFLYVSGVLLAALGTLWTLQGIDVIKGGVMGGHIQYAALGVVTLAIGILLLRVGYRRRKITT